MNIGKLVRNDISRIFIAPNGASPFEEYEYYSCMKIDGLNKPASAVTYSECPHPNDPTKFVKVAEIVGSDSTPWTSTLVGRMPIDTSSILFDLFEKRQSFDLQVHLGSAVNIDDFNNYTMAILLENVTITDYSTDPIGSLESSEVAMVNETVTISAAEVSYIYKPVLASAALDYLSDSVIVDFASSGTNIFALKVPVSGDDLNILYSKNGGKTWGQVTIDCAATVLTFAIKTYSLAADENNLYITLNEDNGNGHLYIIPVKNVLSGSGDTSFISILDNTNAIYDSVALNRTLVTVGHNAKINILDVSTLTYKTLNTSITNALYCISGIDKNNFLIGGASGLILLYNTSTGLVQPPSPTVNTLVAIEMINSDTWVIGTSAGQVYITDDRGVSWDLKLQFNTCIADITFYNSNVGYVLLKTGELYRTIDAGFSWIEIQDEYSLCPDDADAVGIFPVDTNTFYYYGRNPASLIANPCLVTLAPLATDDGFLIRGSSSGK
jgi:hypothetical protein